ncbi:MAG: rhomboid family intramembrane serine protease [Rhodoferax sp.]|nr:rhomboid family intramembrane serine protease [Rhodoferax sp.]
MDAGWRKRPVTVLLLVLNLAVFCCMAISSNSLWQFAPAVSLQWGANFGPATQDDQWWRLLSAVFIHLSLLHVAVNLWALWDVGRLLEGLLGTWRFALVFVASGMVGNLLSLALQNQQRVSSGASGAIFGLYGALLALLWHERKRMAPTEYRWIFFAALGFCTLMLLLGLVIPSMDNAAHAGGLLAGLVLGMQLRPTALVGGGTLRCAWRATTVLALAAVAALALYLGLAQPPYRYADELAARAAIATFLLQDQQLAARVNSLLTNGNLSFNQMADALQKDVAEPYQHSFETLAALQGSAQLPSHATLVQLQSYVRQRQQQALQSARALQEAASVPVHGGAVPSAKQKR